MATQCERILAVLKDGKLHTAAELYRTGCVLHSRISDLRKRGYVIELSRADGVGAESYLYKLTATPRGGEPQADHSGLDALRWVDASSPPPGADAPSAPDYEQLELLSAAKDAARVAA